MSHTPILEYSRTTVAREQKHRRNDAITHQSTCVRQSDRQRTNKRLRSANYVACILLCQGANQENKPWFENNFKKFKFNILNKYKFTCPTFDKIK